MRLSERVLGRRTVPKEKESWIDEMESPEKVFHFASRLCTFPPLTRTSLPMKTTPKPYFAAGARGDDHYTPNPYLFKTIHRRDDETYTPDPLLYADIRSRTPSLACAFPSGRHEPSRDPHAQSLRAKVPEDHHTHVHYPCGCCRGGDGRGRCVGRVDQAKMTRLWQKQDSDECLLFLRQRQQFHGSIVINSGCLCTMLQHTSDALLKSSTSFTQSR